MGVALSLFAGVLLLVVWVRLISQPFSTAVEIHFHGSWTLPNVMRISFAVGWAVLVLAGALVLYIKPKRRSLAATLILAFSTLTLLFWADGYVSRSLGGFYWPPWQFLWRVANPRLDGWLEFLPFDVLAIASVFGVAGVVFGVLWKPKSAAVSIKHSGAKPNLLGVFSAIMAFGSLALPWWVDTNALSPLIFPWGQAPHMRPGVGDWDKIILTGNDTAMYVALAFILVSGFVGLVGSLVVGKKGRFSLVVAGVSAVLSVATFAMALQSTVAHYYGPPFLFGIFPAYGLYYYLSFGF